MTREPEPAAGDQSLGDALLFLRRVWQLNHALERLSARMEKSLGVTAQQRLAIRVIGRMPGVMPSALADILHVDPGTVSATLKRLEAKGLVKRTPHAGDRRRVTLALTARGRALDVPTEGTVEHAVDLLLAGLSPAERDVAEGTLARLATLLDTVGVESQTRPASASRARARRG